MDYLNMLERLYIFDGFAGWDPEVRAAPSTKWLEQQSGVQHHQDAGDGKALGCSIVTCSIVSFSNQVAHLMVHREVSGMTMLARCRLRRHQTADISMSSS